MCGRRTDNVPRFDDTVILSYFEQQLARDAIKAVWNRFSPSVIVMLFVITFVFIGYFTYFTLGRSLYRAVVLGLFSVIGLLGTLGVSLSITSLAYPASKTNVLTAPGVGDDPLAMLCLSLWLFFNYYGDIPGLRTPPARLRTRARALGTSHHCRRGNGQGDVQSGETGSRSNGRYC